MQICLSNFNHNYEIEQLSRMFFSDVKVDFVKKYPKNIQSDFLYVRSSKSKTFVCLKSEDDTLIEFLPTVQDKSQLQMEVCLTAYKFYQKIYNKTLPWGVLTGVRPVRLMRNLYKQYKNMPEVIDVFRKKYLVSEEKINLCTDIFALQQPILENAPLNWYSLYISIPFCPTRCSYCSFVSTSSKSAHQLMAEYVDKLCEEIKYTAKMAEKANLQLQTIYIGGGTPTAITADQLKQVMQTVKENFDLSLVKEYTVEAGRPDCTDFEKLKVIKEYGADRVSINPQTFSDEVLNAIGRKHTHQDFLNCVKMAREVGFKSINMDLIAGLPKDTVESFKKSLQGCIDLGAENITVHTLTLKRASNLVVEHQQHHYDDVSKMIDKTKILSKSNYKPYYMYRQKSTLNNLENVGFSQIGHESLYNIYIMEELQTIISCGAGGVSKVIGKDGDIKRIYNFKYPTEYVKDFEKIIQRKNEVYNLCLQFGYLND